MAKIFRPPESVGPPPEFDFDFETYDMNKHLEEENKWLDKVKAWVKQNSRNKYAGEIIKEPVADGYAQYMVMTPTKLIHLPLGDAWEFRWAERWTGKDVIGMVERSRRVARLFS